MKDNIFVELTGGLGNQMFQYAAARNIQIKTGRNVTYLTNWYKTDKLRDVSINHFSICDSWVEDCEFVFWKNNKFKRVIFDFLNFFEKIINKFFAKKIDENNTPFFYLAKNRIFARMGIYNHIGQSYYQIKKFNEKGNLYITGLWHHPMYFEEIRGNLLEEFRLKDDIELPSVIEQIKYSESVCLHIRRGDYLNYSFYMTCDIAYYKRCIQMMRELHPNCEFFVFSDDISWVKENLNEDVTFIEGNNADYVDMELMRNCKHFIISNSTFSWWAAYLGHTPDKTVMTPDRWYNDGRNKEWLNLPNWISMKTNTES